MLARRCQSDDMKTLTIRGLPDEVYEALERRARLNCRSFNDEVIAVLSDAAGARVEANDEVMRKRLRAERIIAMGDRFRSGMTRFLTAEEIDAAIAEGRERRGCG